jgi:hypothetical protein
MCRGYERVYERLVRNRSATGPLKPDPRPAPDGQDSFRMLSPWFVRGIKALAAHVH